MNVAVLRAQEFDDLVRAAANEHLLLVQRRHHRRPGRCVLPPEFGVELGLLNGRQPVWVADFNLRPVMLPASDCDQDEDADQSLEGSQEELGWDAGAAIVRRSSSDAHSRLARMSSFSSSGKVSHYLLCGHPGRQIAQDVVHGDAPVPDARLAAALSGFDGDAIAVSHTVNLDETEKSRASGAH